MNAPFAPISRQAAQNAATNARCVEDLDWAVVASRAAELADRLMSLQAPLHDRHVYGDARDKQVPDWVIAKLYAAEAAVEAFVKEAE